MKVSSNTVSGILLTQPVQEPSNQGYFDKIENLFKKAYGLVEEGEVVLETVKVITEKLLDVYLAENLQKSRKELLTITGDDRFVEASRVIACYIKRYLIFYLSQEQTCRKEKHPSWMLRLSGENGLTFLGKLVSYSITYNQDSLEDIIEHNILLLFQRVFKRLQGLEDGNPYILLDILLKAFSIDQNKEENPYQSIGINLLEFSFPEGKKDIQIPIEQVQEIFYTLLEEDVLPELVEDFFTDLFSEKSKQDQVLTLLESIERSINVESEEEQYVNYPRRALFQKELGQYVTNTIENPLPKSISQRITNKIADLSIQSLKETKLTELFSKSLFSSLVELNPGGEWKERKFIMVPSVFAVSRTDPPEHDKVYSALSRILKKKDFFESLIIRHVFKAEKPKNPRESFTSVLKAIWHYIATVLTKLFCTVFTLSKRIEAVAKKTYISIINRKYDRHIEGFADAVCKVLSKSTKTLN